MSADAHWFISVGELSGDLLGANLVRELKSQDSTLRLSGIVGPSLVAEGVHAVAQIDELNVMGAIEVLSKLASIKMLKNRILNYIDRHQIRVAILVDFADFHMRLAEELKMREIKVIQYVAPKLWAWREHRIEKLRQNTDLLLATFPFEKKFFEDRGLRCEYVGCPIAQRTESIKTSKMDLGFAAETPLIALLPGSRIQELKRILPPMLAIADVLHQKIPSTRFIVPIAASLQNDSSASWFASLEKEYLRFSKQPSLEIMHAADIALVASGTATLECALLNTPLAVIYAMSPLSFYIAKRNVKVSWASLVNILRKKSVVREFLQTFTTDEVAEELYSLYESSTKKDEMLEDFRRLREDLSQPPTLTSTQAIYQCLR